MLGIRPFIICSIFARWLSGMAERACSMDAMAWLTVSVSLRICSWSMTK